MSVLAVSVFPAGAAAGTLDQSQPEFLGGELEFGGERQAAQTFTAGLTGNLDRVEVAVRILALPSPPFPHCDPGSGIIVGIRKVSAGTPSESLLAITSVPPSSIPTSLSSFVPAVFGTPAPVTAGTQYALVISAPDASCEENYFPYRWGGANGNPYTGGDLFLRENSSSSWTIQAASDAGFKTYVTVNPLPGSSPPPGNPTPSPVVDSDPPETTITKRAPSKTDKTSVQFKFRSDEAGSTFECKLDKKPWKPCSSPTRIGHLHEGTHKFKVRATDPARNTDPSPAKDKFKVVG
jgi:hypothetical protein